MRSLRKLLLTMSAAAMALLPMTTQAAATGDATTSVASLTTCLSAHGGIPTLAQTQACAPNAKMASAGALLQPGQYIIPTKQGYAVMTYAAAATPLAGAVRLAPLSSGCRNLTTNLTVPLYWTFKLADRYCWNGSVAWTVSAGTSCSVWVLPPFSPPGTSCGPSYWYELGRNTYWDYVDGQFDGVYAWIFDEYFDCYFQQKGSGAVPYSDCYQHS